MGPEGASDQDSGCHSSPNPIGGLSVYLHHKAPADQPGFGVGVRRHDGPGCGARFDHGGFGLHPDGVRPRRHRPHGAQIGGTVTGELDATGCDIGVYNPNSVTNADIHGARYFGVVVNGARTVNTTNSKVHQIGEKPFDGTQHGRAILYINGASGTISGNKVYDFQKNGIEVSGLTADGSAASSPKTSVTVLKNVITGEGRIDYIAQNGIVVRGGASAM